MVDGSSWYAKLLHATVRWFRYNIVFCKAVAFMTALCFSHSLVDNGVVGILISYLAENWKNVNLAKVASVINVQDGLSAVMMIVLTHISDTLTGRFMMVVYSTVAYAIGFGLLYLSAMFSSASNVVLFFYLAMVPIAAGRAVRDPTLHAFLGDQIGHQDGPNQDKKRVQARVNFWVRLNEFLGATVAFFVFGHLLWKVSFKISAIAMTISGVLFSCGSRFYYRKKPTGSPMTDVYCVTKAAIRKRNLDYPATPTEFYHNDKGELELLPHVALLSIDQVAKKDVQLKEIWTDSGKNLVSTAFIPPSHPSIRASTSFPEHQSRNTGNWLRRISVIKRQCEVFVAMKQTSKPQNHVLYM